MLNTVVRPLTAKWHRAYEEGKLNGRDGADEFRGELQIVQAKLREFARELHGMAYGQEAEDKQAPDVMPESDLDALFDPLAFGFMATSPEMAEKARLIANDEAAAVAKRR